MKLVLERVGPMSWDALRTHLCHTHGECAWSDFHGFHFGPANRLPLSIPPTTHLWAWDAQRALRVRVDVDRVLVAVLHNTPPTQSALGSLETVHAQVRIGHPWEAADPHVGRADCPLPDGEFTLLELTGSSPAVFIRQGPAAARGADA